MTGHEKTVMKKIRELEESHKMLTLYVVENGARNWGLQSPDSDLDIRFVFLRPMEYYMSIDKRNDVIRGKEDIMDFEGYDIYKAVYLLLKSNPNIIEWLTSSIVYSEVDTDLLRELKRIATEQYNPKALFEAYFSMGKGNFKKYILKNKDVTYKRYLYAFRGMFNALYLFHYGHLPSMNFERDLSSADFVPQRIKAIYLNEIIPKKKQGLRYQIDRIEVLDDYITKLIEEKDTLSVRNIPVTVDRDYLSHLIITTVGHIQ